MRMSLALAQQHLTPALSQFRSVFTGITEEVWDEIVQVKTTHHFKKGDYLFSEGLPVMGIFCLTEGNLKITKSSSDGKEHLLNIAAPGDLVGNIEGNQSVSAIALTAGSFCFIEKNKFIYLLERFPSFAIALVKHFRFDGMRVQERYSHILHKNVRDRVLLLLSDLMDRHGSQSSFGVRINLSLTREEMSSMIGVATETLIRVLSDLREEKIISQAGKVMIILRPEDLKVA